MNNPGYLKTSWVFYEQPGILRHLGCFMNNLGYLKMSWVFYEQPGILKDIYGKDILGCLRASFKASSEQTVLGHTRMAMTILDIYAARQSPTL